MTTVFYRRGALRLCPLADIFGIGRAKAGKGGDGGGCRLGFQKKGADFSDRGEPKAVKVAKAVAVP